MWIVVDSNVIPINDLREHIENGSCWCNPDYDDYPEYGGGIYVHHSLDNRELTEELPRS